MRGIEPICVPFKLDNDDINDVASEFDILYYKSRNQVSDLLDFVRKYKDKRVNIRFPEGVDAGVAQDASEIGNDVAVRLDSTDLTIIPTLQDEEVSYFCDVSLPAYNHVTLAAFLDLGVCDLYISDDLCYQMDDVWKLCDRHDVRLRCVLNRIPSTSFDKGTNVKSIVYRPNDLGVLSKWFDVFELDCGQDPKSYDWAKFDVLHRAWFERGDWHGDLMEINDDLRFSVHNDIMLPTLGDFRSGCGRRCDVRVTSNCRKCEQYYELGRTLFEKNIKVVTEKREDEKNA